VGYQALHRWSIGSLGQLADGPMTALSGTGYAVRARPLLDLHNTHWLSRDVGTSVAHRVSHWTFGASVAPMNPMAVPLRYGGTTTSFSLIIECRKKLQNRAFK
jgi:hypothetical protein